MFPVYLCAAIVDQQDDGSADQENGRAWFVAPFNGKIRRVFISSAAAPGADQNYGVNSAQGRGPNIGTIQTSVTPGAPVEFDLDMFEDTNFMKTGDGFAIESGGEGAVASKGGVIVEFAPG